MDYADIRLLHITCAVISVSLFVLRGVLQWHGMPWRQWAGLRIAPHINDSLLLAAAVALAWRSAQYPLAQAWLSAKLLALLAYILIGRVALKNGPSSRAQRAAFVAALVCVGYILLVARTRSSIPYLS